MKASLDSVRLKLDRAEEHFRAIVAVLDEFSIGRCEFIPEEDEETHVGFQRVHLPKPPAQLPLMIADFLYNIRSALDHLVWQLVLAHNSVPQRGKTAFPICDNRENFETQRKRHRLDGVPDRAVVLIESFQPYAGRDQTLRTLSSLHEKDKHQTLNLTTAVARDTFINWASGNSTYLQTFLGGEELRDGEIFGGIGIPLNDPEIIALSGRQESLAGFRERFLNAKAQGEASIFVAFGDTEAEELEPLRVETVLQAILKHARDEVISSFELFFA
jgi:hypothetical protein